LDNSSILLFDTIKHVILLWNFNGTKFDNPLLSKSKILLFDVDFIFLFVSEY
jgi:hypothetical protein